MIPYIINITLLDNIYYIYTKFLIKIQGTWKLMNNKNKFKWKKASPLNILTCQSRVPDYY